MQTKQLQLNKCSIKLAENGREFSGYASVFNGVDAYGDTIVPGAYSATLEDRERPIRMRWNHYGPVIGKWIEIDEDDAGLFVTGELTPGHTEAENVYASLKHGAVDGLSIGYRVVDSEMDNGITYLKEIELVEISVVEEPADLGAQIGDVKHFKELVDEIGSLKEAEALLRESAGLSKANAVALVSRVKSLALGEQAREKTLFKELEQRLRKH